jgi:hypothetical protein
MIVAQERRTAPRKLAMRRQRNPEPPLRQKSLLRSRRSIRLVGPKQLKRSKGILRQEWTTSPE